LIESNQPKGPPVPHSKSPIRVLLVEDSKSDIALLRKMIKDGMGPATELVCTSSLADALDKLAKEHFDALLLDLLFPGSRGAQSIRRINEQANVPIITLTNSTDDALAVEVLQAGAEDHLIKGTLASQMLYRVIEYAIARHRRKVELQTLLLIDELTGLYNRRAFLTIGEQQLKISSRDKKGIIVGFADLDGLKYINDRFGHNQGDLALKDIAQILKSTFRDSDVLARLGGDEFAVLCSLDAADLSNVLDTRLRSNIDAYLVAESRPYSLSLSIGFTQYASGFTKSLSEMVIESDRRMYEEKLRRYSGGPQLQAR
jgi:two-component system, cell cycle response regulator